MAGCYALASFPPSASIISRVTGFLDLALSQITETLSVPGRDTRPIRSNPHKIVRMFFYLIHTARRSPSLPAPRAAIRRPRVLDRVPTVQLPLGPTLFERNFEALGNKVLITLSTLPSTIRGELAAGGATLAIHGTTEVFRILVSDNVKHWYPTNTATPPSRKWPSQNLIQGAFFESNYRLPLCWTQSKGSPSQSRVG